MKISRKCHICKIEHEISVRLTKNDDAVVKMQEAEVELEESIKNCKHNTKIA